MKKIILNLAVTLDGFIEGPNGETDWCNIGDDTGTEGFFDSFLQEVDSIFYGRISYDLWGQYLPAADASAAEKNIWNAVHAKKKYVFSHKPAGDDKAIWINTELNSSVQQIKETPGKNIWLYGGANLIASFINAG